MTQTPSGAAALPPVRAVILDVDGTLIDNVYQHALAWYSAMRTLDVEIPIWVLHRHVGMGGDTFVEAVGGPDLERRHGDRLRALHGERFAAMLSDTRPLPGATRFVHDLVEAGFEVVLASSGKREEVDHHIHMLDIEHVLTGKVSSADVAASKPSPDLLEAALDILGHRDAVMVGDTTWDCHAATAAGLPCVTVLTGGFGTAELREAGALLVADTLAELGAAIREGRSSEGTEPDEAGALTRLQGEVAADPELAGDAERFSELVRSLADEFAPQASSRERLQRRLFAMREQLQQAGS